MNKIYIVVLLVLSNIAISQEGYPKISLELGYNYQRTDMTKFNHHLDLIKTDVFKLDDRLDYVNNFKLAIKVKPISLFDFGVYFGNQQITVERFPIQKKLNPDLTTTDVLGYHKNKITSLDIGFASTLYLDHFFKNDNRILEKIYFGLDIQVGIGFSKYYSETHYNTFFPTSVGSAIRKADGFQGQVGLSFEYSFFKVPFITALGVRLGYQFYNTSSLEDRFGIKWGDSNYEWTSADEEINLDFSGIYYGVYLKIGK